MTPGPVRGWGLLALAAGAVLATRKTAALLLAFVVGALGQRPGRQAGVRAVRLGFLRALGSFFTIGGAFALAAALVMMNRR